MGLGLLASACDGLVSAYLRGGAPKVRAHSVTKVIVIAFLEDSSDTVGAEHITVSEVVASQVGSVLIGRFSQILAVDNQYPSNISSS